MTLQEPQTAAEMRAAHKARMARWPVAVIRTPEAAIEFINGGGK